MQVIATAGHVDHGKSALVRALTGMEPDRWAEERRRGLTIDLGFAWLTQPDGQRLAFVDVPGHERFVPNMLAGVGPLPAVLFVVAADGGWMPQSAEHLAAIDALGISRGLLAVTRADLAAPFPAMSRARAEIARTSLGEVPAVAVSAVTGEGLSELRAALAGLAAELPSPDPGAPARLWLDRVFSITGSGTVVTGTLPAGTLHAGDELLVTPAGRPVRIRGIQSLKERVARISGVARVALNLRGTPADSLTRGMALVAPGSWTLASTIDVRLAVPPGSSAGPARPYRQVLSRQVTVHIGSARTAARVRPLGGPFVRLSLREPLPLHVGDRLLLRDPGAARSAWNAGHPPGTLPEGDPWPAITGAVVFDVRPPGLPRRGAAAAAHAELGRWPEIPGPADLLRRHGLMRPAALEAMGLAFPPGAPGSGNHRQPGRDTPVLAAGWLIDPGYWARLRGRLGRAVAEHSARDPLAPGMPLEAARTALGLPDRRVVEALAAVPPAAGPGTEEAGPSSTTGLGQRLAVRGGYVCLVPAAADDGQGSGPRRPATQTEPGASPGPALPERVTRAVRTLLGELAASPFGAPEANRLRELGLDRRALAAAERAGLLLRVSPEIVLAPGADGRAARLLAPLPQPFTTAQARQALGTTRRVAIPLLEYLDRAGVTQRLPDDRRKLRDG